MASASNFRHCPLHVPAHALAIAAMSILRSLCSIKVIAWQPIFLADVPLHKSPCAIESYVHCLCRAWRCCCHSFLSELAMQTGILDRAVHKLPERLYLSH